jgi:hypothetical protein
VVCIDKSANTTEQTGGGPGLTGGVGPIGGGDPTGAGPDPTGVVPKRWAKAAAAGVAKAGRCKLKPVL